MARARLQVWLMAVMLLLVTMVLYWPATRCGFISLDDFINVTRNVHVQKGLSWGSIKWALLKPLDLPGWQPLTMWSHMALYQLFGFNPWAHHLANVVLHALNAALVFALLQQMTGAAWRSWWVAALFAVHPLRVEAVAWVTERRELLSVCFGLLALIAYVRYTEVQRLKSNVQSPESVVRPPSAVLSTRHNSATVDGWSFAHLPSSLFYLLSLGFFVLSLMSKPTILTLPFLMLLLDCWPLRRFQLPTIDSQRSTTWRLVREKIPWFVLMVSICILGVVVLRFQGELATGEALPWGARIGNALVSYCRYLGKMMWPTGLVIFYLHPGYWPTGKVLLAAGLILGISVLVWAPRRRYPFLLVGWLWYCGTLVPQGQLVPIAAQAMADRWTYVPSVGVLILAVWGACELTRGWRYRMVALSLAGGGAILLCLALTRHQLGYWQDSETVYRHAADVTPANPATHAFLGSALLEQGRLDEAIVQFQEAIRLQPAYAVPHKDFGTALYRKGQLDEAIRHFEQAVRLKADDAEAHYNLGGALDRKGRLDEAISQFQEAIRLQPDYPAAQYNLGTAFCQQGRTEEAIRQFQEAIRLKPDLAEAHNNLGTALGQKGQRDEAIRQYQEALRLKPDFAEARKNLDVMLATKAHSSLPPGASTSP